MNTKYVKQPLSSQLPAYLDHELRKIEVVSSDHALAMDEAEGDIEDLETAVTALESAVATLTAAPTWTAVTFQNSWVNFDVSTWEGAAYYKDPLGFVHVKGLVKNGTLNATIFTLPAGFRPPKGLLYAQVANGAFTRLDVNANGTVVTVGAASNGYQSINLSFSTN